MKHKKTINLLSLVVIAASSFSCNDEGLLSPVENTDYSIIDGDTIRVRQDANLAVGDYSDRPTKFGLILGDTTVLFKGRVFPNLSNPPDISRLSERALSVEKPFRMIALGGSLTAGVRSFGYFNEGIDGNYASLVAKQMGVRFNNPLFPSNDFNGIGRKEFTRDNYTSGPVLKYKNVSNNTGLTTSGEKVSVRGTNISNIDNLSIPYVGEHVFLPFSTNYGQSESFTALIESRSLAKSDRAWDKFYDLDADFFLLESGFNSILSLMENPDNVWAPSPEEYIMAEDFEERFGLRRGEDNSAVYSSWTKFHGGISVSLAFMIESSFRGRKGVIINSPNPWDLPFYNQVKSDAVYQVFRSENALWPYHSDDLQNIKFIPNSTLDSLLSPIVSSKLKPGIDSDRPLLLVGQSHSAILKHHSDYNKEKELLSKRFNVPLVDLDKLYKDINAGSYITHDGIKVNPSYPGGNFYSSDGIFPTAFGQAIIANEVIRIINLKYETNVPLIDTSKFLN